MRKQSDILQIMEIFEKDNPNPQCELNYLNAYTLLVAVILSFDENFTSKPAGTKSPSFT